MYYFGDSLVFAFDLASCEHNIFMFFVLIHLSVSSLTPLSLVPLMVKVASFSSLTSISF